MNLAIHKTFETDNSEKRLPVLRVSDGETVQKLSGDKITEWMNALKIGVSLRFTSVHAQDPIINDLVKRGHEVVYANWHKTGIEKNSEPDEIVRQFATLSAGVFRKFEPRPDLSELRYRVSQRLAIVEFRKAAILKLKGAGRTFGQVEEEDLPEEIQLLLAEAEKNETRVPITSKGKEKFFSIDTVISNLAKDIPECREFNKAAHLSSGYNTAAAVVAFSGGIDRFDNVASFWHYCGQDPTSNRKKKGQPVSYNPKLKTILWQMSDSIFKNRNNPWRDYYDLELEKELAVHAQKHPECKKPTGHCMARAKVKMRKEILKRFFLAVKGQEYGGHPESENRSVIAAVIS